MENITVGQIGTGLVLIVGIVSSIEFMFSRLKKWLSFFMKSELQPVNDKIVEIDIAQSKNFLVRCLNDLEAGRTLNQDTIRRMYEVYDHYANDLHQNSYIHECWEKCEKEGKL